jgi:FAD/FMN-containing dehydrogenase
MLKLALRIVAIAIAMLLVGAMSLFYIVSASPEPQNVPANIVRNVSSLNDVEVAAVLKPHTLEDIQKAVRENDHVSIGGARHSMGGQIAAENSIHLDMREFNRVIDFSKDSKTITVQSGVTWRKIQEYIDPHDLSVMIMQTYSDFTVGGSLSVNVHGRYVGYGPIIHSVKSIKIVLANGDLVTASPSENQEIFYGAIGGYGGLGVIAEAELALVNNSKVRRSSVTMPAAAYASYFLKNIRSDSTVIFHNADIYPDDYENVRANSFALTDEPVTVHARLHSQNESYRWERFGMWMVSEAPFGKWIREHWADPVYYENDVVCWRNYEASYNAAELEPTSRDESTYVLQEYFVPVAHFEPFLSAMKTILRESDVNVINVSVRHAKPDSLSILSWAPKEVFCFVLYIKHGTSESDVAAVSSWTQKLIDAALDQDGAYYLPYEIFATGEQFNRAYEKSPAYFALKRRLDPDNKYRNKLLDKYDQLSTYRPVVQK